MSKLSHYSIETDRTVLLSFSDQSNVRVPISRVKEYVAPNELKTIEKALMMRENFFKRHLPKFAISFVAGGLLVATSFHENTVLNRLFQPSSKRNPTLTAEQTKKNLLPTAVPLQHATLASPGQQKNNKTLSGDNSNTNETLSEKLPRLNINMSQYNEDGKLSQYRYEKDK